MAGDIMARDHGGNLDHARAIHGGGDWIDLSTGINRRPWPLRCGTIDIAALARHRDQLWAEAVHRFRAGAIWWIGDPALLAEAREEQDRRYQSDAWDDLIEHWLTHEIRTVSDGFPDYGNSRTESVPRPEPLNKLSVGEILEEAIGLEPARWTRGDQMRVSA